MAGPAVYFDGQTATGHEVDVQAVAEGVLITPAEGEAFVWPLARLRLVGENTLGLWADGADEQSREAARLMIRDAGLMEWITRAAPDLHRRDLATGTWMRLAKWVGAAGAALGLILFVLVPMISDRLAMELPRDTEVAFGDAVLGQMEQMLSGRLQADLVCKNPAGLAALEALRQRLVAGQGLDYDLKLLVLDHEMLNAFAVPGGRVVILRGLLEGAKSPDEVAGVLAHEIGHVEARDPTRLAFRAAGSAGIVSLLFGDVSGGAVLGIASNHLMSAGYTRAAEAAADQFAFDLMGRAGIGTAGLATFFDRIDGLDGDLPEYLSTHPDSGNRAEAARAADKEGTTPALTEAEWRDLRGICDAA